MYQQPQVQQPEEYQEMYQKPQVEQLEEYQEMYPQQPEIQSYPPQYQQNELENKEMMEGKDDNDEISDERKKSELLNVRQFSMNTNNEQRQITQKHRMI
jgi:hypothetical protein